MGPDLQQGRAEAGEAQLRVLRQAGGMDAAQQAQAIPAEGAPGIRQAGGDQGPQRGQQFRRRVDHRCSAGHRLTALGPVELALQLGDLLIETPAPEFHGGLDLLVELKVVHLPGVGTEVDVSGVPAEAGALLDGDVEGAQQHREDRGGPHNVGLAAHLHRQHQGARAQLPGLVHGQVLHQ